MTPELLSSAAGMLISLLAAYLPPFARRYAALDGDHKRVVMLAALLLTSLGALALACSGLQPPDGAACDAPGAYRLAKVFIAALAANQSTYVLAVRPPK